MLSDRDYMRDQPSRWKGGVVPDAVTIIIAANVVVWVMQHAFLIGAARGDYGEVDLFGACSLAALAEGRFWTLFTHMFVHGSVLHLMGNCLMIFFAGRAVQSLLGAKQFLSIYFISGLVGAIVQLSVGWLTGDRAGLIGASACGFGVFIALAVMLPQEVVTALIYFIIPVQMRLRTFARLLVGVSVVFGTMQLLKIPLLEDMHLSNGPDHIAHFAHLGGALAGWFMVRWMGYGGPVVTYDKLWAERRKRAQSPEMAGVKSRRRVVDVDEPDDLIIPVALARDFIEREVDPILDKIAAHGMGSLTDEERKILERGRQEILNRQK